MFLKKKSLRRADDGGKRIRVRKKTLLHCQQFFLRGCDWTLQRTSRLCTKKEKKAMKNHCPSFLGKQKKVSIFFISTCCVRNLRPPYKRCPCFGISFFYSAIRFKKIGLNKLFRCISIQSNINHIIIFLPKHRDFGKIVQQARTFLRLLYPKPSIGNAFQEKLFSPSTIFISSSLKP